MSWSGGTYTKGNNATGGWTGDASLGIGIEAGRHDTQDNDFATGINNCIAKDGQNAATADLPMGGFKHTNVANATARNNYAAVGQVQDGDFIWLGTTGGTATAQTATATPAITAYKSGQKFRMKPGFASTGQVYTSHTLNVNGLGAVAIIEQDGQSPTVGSWGSGTARVLELVYNDGYFVVTQAPKYWLPITPTLTPQNGTASSVTWNYARFVRVNNTIFINVYVTWTQNTASAAFIDVSLPVRPSAVYQGLNCSISTGAGLAVGFAVIGSVLGSGVVRCYDYNQGQILTGAKSLIVNGFYEIG